MAVVENAMADSMTSSNRDGLKNAAAEDNRQSGKAVSDSQKSTTPADQSFHLTEQNMSNGNHKLHQLAVNGNGVSQENKLDGDDDGREGFRREIIDLAEMLSKLNPMAEEFVPPSLASFIGGRQMVVSPQAAAAAAAGHFGYKSNSNAPSIFASTGKIAMAAAPTAPAK